MTSCSLALFLMSLLHSALGSLHAPVDLNIDSLNLHHVLRWDPAPGTPPGTLYKIYSRFEGQKDKWKYLNSTRATSFQLKLKTSRRYYLTVQVDNQTLPPEPLKIPFNPYEDTKIGPPKVSLAGCGNCIRVNISLHKKVQKFYSPKFHIFWRKENEAVSDFYKQDRTFIIHNLEKRVKYCVKVHVKSPINVNTEPSTWECIYTSPVETSTDVAVLVGGAALLVVIASVLMTSMLCLCYTGFLCKLQAVLPTALITALSHGYTLTPEKTTVHQISISINKEKQRVRNNPITSQHASSGEEEEEEEEQGDDNYMDRNAELSSGESSCRNSNNMSGNSKAAASGQLSAEVEGPATEFGVELDRDEAKDQEVVSLIPEGDQTGVQRHFTSEEEEREEKMEVFESSANVNLFSVTLAALAVSEEEEQNTRDSLSSSDPECLLSTVSKLRNTDSETSDDQTAVGSVHPTHKDFNEGEGRQANTQGEEEQEEEEFSEYMAHV